MAIATALRGLRRTAAATSSRAVLHVIDLVASEALDVAGKALQVGAKTGQILGNLIKVVAEPLAGGHFGVDHVQRNHHARRRTLDAMRVVLAFRAQPIADHLLHVLVEMQIVEPILETHLPG